MSKPAGLTLATLTDAVAGRAVAIRAITRLLPAGGAADKVFPPTYVKDKQSQTKYAMETRRVDGRECQTVLLDSVASQANRIEEALLEAVRRGEVRVPVISVDFSTTDGLEDLEEITSLQAPHRVADALLRDSLDEQGVPFRQTAVGRACTDARPNHATGMFRYCPTALVFGVWDSTGPRGGLGAKFQRALVSEIVGFDVVAGVKTASRLDPAGIVRQEVYEAKSDPTDWTVVAAEAASDKGKPRPFSRGGGGEKGTPAAINHGNIPPSIDAAAGGVTMSHAVHTAVLSLAALRKLRFQRSTDGGPIVSTDRDRAEIAGRTALAALAIAGVVYQRRNGYDLRSRSLLVPADPLVFELLPADGGEPTQCLVDDPAALLHEAAAAASAVGLAWEERPVRLKPTPKLAHLISESRKLKTAGVDDDGEA